MIWLIIALDEFLGCTMSAPLVLFVVGGAKRAKLEREAMKRTLTNFRVRPYQPKGTPLGNFSVADVHLVSLDPRLEGFIVPSKFYGIAAAGRPHHICRIAAWRNRAHPRSLSLRLYRGTRRRRGPY